jgi:hypothetical protein
MRPPDMEAPGPVGGTTAGREEWTTDSGHATTPAPFDQDEAAAERERGAARDAQIADLRRRAASRRYTLHVLDSGELMFTWAGLNKTLPDARSAARWLDHCGVPR